MTVTSLCRNGHATAHHTAVIADLAGGWAALSFCATCGLAVEAPLTEPQAKGLTAAQWPTPTGETLAQLRHIHAALHHSLRATEVQMWAESLEAVRTPLAWLNTGVTA